MDKKSFVAKPFANNQESFPKIVRHFKLEECVNKVLNDLVSFDLGRDTIETEHKISR